MDIVKRNKNREWAFAQRPSDLIYYIKPKLTDEEIRLITIFYNLHGIRQVTFKSRWKN